MKMKKPCIAIDVSKGSSHVRSYITYQQEYKKLLHIKHDKQGLQSLLQRYQDVYQETGKQPVFIMEATGVYHKGIETYLKKQQLTYYIISPLLSAKYRKLDIRGVKTDKLDPIYIAKVYYNAKLKKVSDTAKTYDTIKQLNRYYESQVDALVKAKVNYKESLDIVFPMLNEIESVYHPVVKLVLSKYRHPEAIAKKQLKTLLTYLEKKTNHTDRYLHKITLSIYEYCKECISGCSQEDVTVDILLGQLENVEYLQNKCDKILQQIIEISKGLENYHIIKSIPGIGENLASRLVAEIGDIERFDNPKQLIAYAGIEPIVYQSGKNSGLHYRMSKRGNKRLRRLLYLAITCSIRNRTTNNSIKEYYQRKRHQEQPMNCYSAYFACANKLLRIIYGMCTNGTLYQ